MLLTGDVPNGGEPDAKLGARLIENSPRSCRRLMSARRANQSATTHPHNLGYHPALWANQTTTPSQLLQVIPARLLRVKPIKTEPKSLGSLYRLPGLPRVYPFGDFAICGAKGIPCIFIQL